MSYLRIAWSYFRVNVLNELAYRTNFFVQVLEAFLELIVALGGVMVVYSHTDNLGGWTAPELRTLIGVYMMVGGAIALVLQPGMQLLMEDVRKGTLDFILTKPADAQLLVSVRQVQIWKLTDILLGIVLLIVSMLQMGQSLSGVQVLNFAVTMLAGGAIIYSFCLMLATLTFWFVRMENVLFIFNSMYDAGRWPLTLYPRWLRGILTFVVPVGFAVTVPSQALLGKLDGGTLLLTIALAVFMLVASRLFWLFGVRHYSGASA
jgi:ABC-2 type transport system permease protein